MSLGYSCYCELGNAHHDVNIVWLEEVTMGKLIIDNRSSIDDASALIAVRRVVSEGSGQYPYSTGFEIDGARVMVYTGSNKCSDKFVVVDEKHSRAGLFW